MLRQVLRVFVAEADCLPLLVRADCLLPRECSALSGQETQHSKEQLPGCQGIGFLGCTGSEVEL